MSLVQELFKVMPLQQEAIYSLRILTACVCGLAIGIERTSRLKQAGIRTHCIIACTASVMMIISKYCFGDMGDAAGNFMGGTRGADPARIAAQVVSGISFLGAGVLLKKGDTIKGLTTAAGFWVTTAIGLSIGSGMYYTGIFTTVLVIVIQVIFHRVHIGCDTSTYTVKVMMEESAARRSQLVEELKQNHMKVSVGKVEKMEGDLLEVELLITTSLPLSLEEAVVILKRNQAISSISL